MPNLIASESDSGGGISNKSEYFVISSSLIPSKGSSSRISGVGSGSGSGSGSGYLETSVFSIVTSVNEPNTVSKKMFLSKDFKSEYSCPVPK